MKQGAEKIVCVGGSGRLGGEIVHKLVSAQYRVLCLVRKASDITRLRETGAEIIVVDFSDANVFEPFVSRGDTVISTFATDVARQPQTDGLWQNDYAINFRLVQTAVKKQVRKFIFTSYWGLAKFGCFEHGTIKKMIEDLLILSGMDYTVLRITTLATDMSLLLGAVLKKRGIAPVIMKKNDRVRPILLADLAACVVSAIDNRRAAKRIIEVAGKEEYTFLELEALFTTAIGKKVRLVFIPSRVAELIAVVIDSLTRCKYNGRGLVSAFSGGSTCDIGEMDRVFQVKQGSFRDYLNSHFAA